MATPQDTDNVMLNTMQHTSATAPTLTTRKILAKATEAEATMVVQEAMISTTDPNSIFACRLSFALLAAVPMPSSNAQAMNVPREFEQN
jgi:hypothetical protein